MSLATRRKHQVSLNVIQLQISSKLNVARINAPSSTKDVPSPGSCQATQTPTSKPFSVQVRVCGLMFALTRSRRSSLVAFWSGRSPLFKSRMISFCGTRVAKKD